MIFGGCEKIFGAHKHTETLYEEAACEILRNLIGKHNVFQTEIVAVVNEKIGRNPVAGIRDDESRNLV